MGEIIVHFKPKNVSESLKTAKFWMFGCFILRWSEITALIFVICENAQPALILIFFLKGSWSYVCTQVIMDFLFSEKTNKHLLRFPPELNSSSSWLKWVKTWNELKWFVRAIKNFFIVDWLKWVFVLFQRCFEVPLTFSWE